MVQAHEVEMLRAAEKAAQPAADVARHEYVRETMAWLMKRHRKSLEYLAAYDRGEIERPPKTQRVTE